MDRCQGFDFTPSEPYEWGLGSGSGPGYHNRWILQSATSLVDKGFIPQYALPLLNDEFGSMNGTIRLKDKYNNPVYSTDLRPNKKAQVFFLKDEPNFGKCMNRIGHIIGSRLWIKRNYRF
ncbi:MAG: hypothetical protein IPP06_12640 [Saprospiraceae bacterium]|nr:hypothetical protein [Candidatus Vicinibacter affinis]